MWLCESPCPHSLRSVFTAYACGVCTVNVRKDPVNATRCVTWDDVMLARHEIACFHVLIRRAQ
jgi:hypothetical protein